MSEQDAVSAAERAALEAGYALDDYEQASVRSDDRGWWVFYRLKPPGRVGGHFSVRVEDAGVVRLTPGR